jgi:hypothetical protein
MFRTLEGDGPHFTVLPKAFVNPGRIFASHWAKAPDLSTKELYLPASYRTLNLRLALPHPGAAAILKVYYIILFILLVSRLSIFGSGVSLGITLLRLSNLQPCMRLFSCRMT